MKIGIIGTGRMGSGLGKRWASSGRQVMFGSRSPEKARRLAAETGANASSGSYRDAVAFAEVIVLVIPWSAAEEVVRSLGSLDGKIIVDVTNNFVDQNPLSSTERIMAWAPGAKVVKAFNTIFSDILQADPASAKERASSFMVGNDVQAKQVVAQLISDAGFDPVDVGPAKNAYHLEHLLAVIGELGLNQGLGRNVAFKLVRT